MMKTVPGFFHLLMGHIGQAESTSRRSDFLPCQEVVGDKLFLRLVQKLRHLPIADTVNVMRRVLSDLMKHYHVGNGKAVSLEVCGVVDIETLVNLFKGHIRRKGRGIDKVIVSRVNGKPRRGQAVVRLKAEIPRFVAAL